MALITCRDVSLAYENQIVLTHVDFTVEPGDCLCIVGENGSGKSTLVKALLGLKAPKSGTITYGDGLAPDAVGYLPQQTELRRDFPASVGEVVLSGCRPGALGLFYTAADRRCAAKNMEVLGIAPLRRQCFAELSGGQQQRALLARALCATEKLLLLDEPTAGLDPVVTAELYEVVRALNREHGITVVMISHDLEGVFSVASKVLHLKREQIFFGTVADYRRSAAVQSLLGGEHRA